MPRPQIFITFQTLASTAIKRSDKGTLLLLLRDAKAEVQGTHVITRTSQIPEGISEDNKTYIERAFEGYETSPKKIILHIDTAESEDLSAGIAFARTQDFDYLCAPPDVTPEECTAIISMVKDERANNHKVKAVLPNQAADHEGIVNFTGDGIKVGEKTFNTAQYCSRIAGIIAGTPMKMSCTYAPLPEAQDITRLTDMEGDTAVDAGKLILEHDGVKVKLSRAVNSLTSLTITKGKQFQKIKIVELLDMIFKDIRQTVTDQYIGKFANSYDNKMILVTAIKNYLQLMERDGLIREGSSVVEIDLDAQTKYLIENSVDVSEMSEQQIKEANTGSSVFIKVSISPLDAIEDVFIPFTIENA